MIKSDLEKQITEKHEKDTSHKKEALSGWLKQLEEREKHAAEEALKKRADRESLLQQNSKNIRAQLQQRIHERTQVKAKQKAEELSARMRAEADALAAEREEKEKRLVYKEKLKTIKQEDTQIRMDFYNTHRSFEPTESMDNSLITKFFDRPKHVAHDLREKNDAVQGFISKKWALSTPRVKSIERPGENFLEARNQREAQKEQERDLSRKKKEYEVARALDLQVEKHKAEAQSNCRRDREIGRRVHQDADEWHAEREAQKQARLEKNRKHKQELETLIAQRAKIADYIARGSAYNTKKKEIEEVAAEPAVSEAK